MVLQLCKERISFYVGLVSRKLWEFLFTFPHLLSYLCFLYQSLSSSLCTVFDATSGLKKLHAQLRQDAHQVPKPYWEAQNIRHVVKLCCVMLFSRYFVAVLFAFIFYVINITDEEACEKKIHYYSIFFSPLHVYKEWKKLKTYYLQDRYSLCTRACPILRPMGSYNYFKHPILQHKL